MIRAILSIAIAIAIALSASKASAATYVTGPLPAEFGAGFIPPDAKVLKNVQKVSALGAKLSASVEKCYSKGAASYAKGQVNYVEQCISIVVAQYQIAAIKVAFKAPGLPLCNDQVGNGDVVASLVKGFNGLIYCQSPSGAFVDGTTSF